MDFEYTATLWVEPSAIEEMLELCRHGSSYEQAIEDVAAGWDDIDYYAVGNVVPQLAMELKRRLEAEKETNTND